MTKAQSPTRPFDVTHKSVLAIAVPMTLAYLTTPLLGFVDIAVVGQLGSAALLGGLAVAAIIFDLLFGTFNFLRSATTGLVAQAVGRGDKHAQLTTFWRSFLIAFFSGLVLILLHKPILELGLWIMGASADVRMAASEYFVIRIISAPAALVNYALLGYFLGQGRGRLALLFQTLLYGLNIILSIYLGLTLGWGLQGVAIATVIAEIVVSILGLVFVVKSAQVPFKSVMNQLSNSQAFKKLMTLNGDIMIRSFVLVGTFAWFTRLGGQLSDENLAANAILMNFLMVVGYFLDGFATAGEQLAGRSIGANYKPAFIKTVRLTTLWGFFLAGLLFAFFALFGPSIIDLMTTNENVRELAKNYYLWAALIALTGVLAFQMDGIFIGATWSNDMRNMMLLSAVVFIFSSHFLMSLWGNAGLWVSLNLFMITRGISLSLILPKRQAVTFVS